ncbi:hypothetical protein [Aurantiacibacter suaedae]|uniref:hypothetical protein n=1 Tax=Aurantiacibacter suaedae TaxID=2545755 RepID=UPI001F4FF870|nr:hypothetical protein [Aurantiacibacter suaedae]
MLTTWRAPGGSEELAIRFGDDGGPRLLVLPAWFDESNKTRHFTVETMRLLAERGVASVLPDLPGCNESMAELTEQTFGSWREAAMAAAKHFECTHVLAMRAGVNISPDLPGFAYAPLAGKSVLRALLRARTLAAKEAGRPETTETLLQTGKVEGLELAGYYLGAAMVADLAEAVLAPSSLVPLDPGGQLLWLRAEPEHNPKQAAALADLIAKGMVA